MLTPPYGSAGRRAFRTSERQRPLRAEFPVERAGVPGLQPTTGVRRELTEDDCIVDQVKVDAYEVQPRRQPDRGIEQPIERGRPGGRVGVTGGDRQQL